MTNNANARITPADIEYVPVSSIAIGDVLVQDAHTRKQHGDETPSARKLATATFVRVNDITFTTTRVTDFNINETSRTTVLNTINVWRVKR
jgi:hypothetical protein